MAMDKTLEELVKMARNKVGFVDGAAMAGGGDPAAAAAGGAPPPGGDPAAMGGAPPPPPEGGGGMDPMMIQQMVQQAVQQAMAGQGGGGGGAGGGGALKPKVDVNVTLLQILKIVTRMAEAQGVEIPPSEMVPDMTSVNQLAQMSQSGDFSGAGGGAGGGQQQSAIPPIEPMQAAGPAMGKQSKLIDDGHAYEGIDRAAASMTSMSHQAQAIALVMSGGR